MKILIFNGTNYYRSFDQFIGEETVYKLVSEMLDKNYDNFRFIESRLG